MVRNSSCKKIQSFGLPVLEAASYFSKFKFSNAEEFPTRAGRKPPELNVRCNLDLIRLLGTTFFTSRKALTGKNRHPELFPFAALVRTSSRLCVFLQRQNPQNPWSMRHEAFYLFVSYFSPGPRIRIEWKDERMFSRLHRH